MKQPRLSRRQFFQASAFGAGALALPALGLAAVAATPTREAQAAAEQPLAPAIPQPTFNPIASNTTFGPLTDISMGWDGTVWGIDGQGAPHVYDPINKVWAQHGDGIDAAAWMLSTNVAYLFQGDQVITVSPATMQASAPQLIGTVWPNLPDSFKLGVVGAGSLITGGLMLFNSGRYVTTDNSIPAGKLVNLPGWPQTPNWKDGVIDGVINSTLSKFVLMRMGEAVEVDMMLRQVKGPAPLNQVIDTSVLPASWATGFDAATFTQLTPTNPFWLFKGTAAAIMTDSSGTAQLQYLGNLVGNWPATWHPALQHAPNGRDGNLWSVLTGARGSYTVQHDGDSWTQLPYQADHVGVGQDNAVMLASAQRLWSVTANSDNTGYNVSPVSQPNNLIQVSLGNANAVFARDMNNNVYSFDPTSGALAQNTDVGMVTHLATTNDGSLWHAKPGNPNMNLLLVGSGAPPQAIAVKQGLTATVNKVAATGFGAAHCLTQDSQGNTQAYRYDSPYVFKTATPYDTGSYSLASPVIEQGAGLLFFTDTVLVDDNPLILKSRIVTIDAHTGVEVASTAWLSSPLGYIQPVFDPIHTLVYVGTASIVDESDSATPGQLLALDARTLAVKWSFTAAAGIDAAPALNGTRLCVGDRTGKLYMFDTTDALANPSNVRTKWVVEAVTNTAQTHRIATPTFVGDVEDLIYTAVWDCNSANGDWTVQGTWVSYLVPDGSPNDRLALHTATGNFGLATALAAPAHGKLNIASSETPQLSPALFYNCFDAVIGIGAGPTVKTFSLPAGDFITTGFAYDAETDVVWFGSYNGTLYCLDINLNTVNYTPYTPAPQNNIFTTPVIFRDTQGNGTILFGIDEGRNLMGFDPDNGNIASLATGATRVYALSRFVTNGMIYVGGSNGGATAPGQFPQVFGIRVDDLPQAERDFIIESQLMQDPQDPGGTGGSTVTAPDGNVIPPSVARYQTHLTVVDDKKTSQPNEPVKIWADVDGTVITVNNQTYTVGPADAAFASVTTGVDGSLVIVSDATDVNASALRVWAAFMDPYERIVIYPDHEWHGRASQSNANGSVADPAKPNLNTAYSYKPDASTPGSTTPKPLFTSDEKNQGTPTNVANAVGQMNTGLNPGGNSPAAVAGALKTLHASNPAAPYVAYTDLGGMHYGPNNARAQRTATISAPIGFVLNKPQDGAHTFTPMSHSDARSAIDALPYPLWDPNNPSGKPTPAASDAKPLTFVVRRTDNIFTDFWNWLVSAFNAAVDAIENVIVSVADDIMVGINFIIDGVKQAFKAIIKVIDDVVNAIGSFFLQLAKLIEDLIEALSVLFHFGEIIWMHNWMKGQINTQLAYLKDAITTTIKPAVDGLFQKGENAINAAISNLQQQLTPNGQISNLKGAGSTPHSTFNVGPKGGTPSSQSVQCSHSSQKLKDGLPSASSPSPSAALRPAQGASPSSSSDDPVADFVASFTARITNGDLAQKFDDTKNQINNLFKANSATQFFESFVSTLLDILAALLDGVFEITNALLDGILGIFDDFIDALMNPTTGLLNAPLDIPFISWLYQLLFNEQLTIINALTLVAAIPATILFRVVEGQYPSAVLGTAAERKGVGAQSVQALTPYEFQGYQFFYGCVVIGGGIANGLGDFLANAAPPLLGWATVGVSLVAACLSVPAASNATPSAGDWAVFGIGLANALYGLYLIKASDVLNKFDGGNAIAVFCGCFINVVYLMASIFAFNDDGSANPSTDTGLAANIIGSISGMLNFLKYIGATGKTVAVVLDVACAVVAAALAIASALLATSPAPLSRRLHFPFVAFNPQPMQAHPLRLAPVLAGATP